MFSVRLVYEYQGLFLAQGAQRDHPEQEAGSRDGQHPEAQHSVQSGRAGVANKKHYGFAAKVNRITDRIEDYVSVQRYRIIDQEAGDQKHKEDQARNDRSLKSVQTAQNAG